MGPNPNPSPSPNPNPNAASLHEDEHGGQPEGGEARRELQLARVEPQVVQVARLLGVGLLAKAQDEDVGLGRLGQGRLHHRLGGVTSARGRVALRRVNDAPAWGSG